MGKKRKDIHRKLIQSICNRELDKKMEVIMHHLSNVSDELLYTVYLTNDGSHITTYLVPIKKLIAEKKIFQRKEKIQKICSKLEIK